MKCFSKFFGSLVAIVLVAGPTLAADTVSAGKVKTINADKQEFVLTDGNNKDWTIKLGDKVVINRGGKETKSDLKADDVVNVSYEKGLLTWTAHYILVQEGDTKNYELVHGTVKSYDVGKKQVDVTNEQGKDLIFTMGDAKVRLNLENSKIEDMKIGDHFLAIVEKTGDKATLKCLMVERK
jgi:hypothetical protein